MAKKDIISKDTNKEGLAFLFEITGCKPGNLLAAGILIFLTAALSIAPVLVIYLIMRTLSETPGGETDKAAVFTIILTGTGIILLRFILGITGNLLFHSAAFKLVLKVKMKLIEHIGKLSMGFFSQRSIGSIKKVVNDDTQDVEAVIAHYIPDIISGVFLILTALTCIFVIDWRLGLVMLIPIPLLFAGARWMEGAGHNAETLEKVHNSVEQLNANVVEYVRGMNIIKVFNQTIMTFKRLKESIEEANHQHSEIMKNIFLPSSLLRLLSLSVMFILLPAAILIFLPVPRGSLASLANLFIFLLLGGNYLLSLIRVFLSLPALEGINKGVEGIKKLMEMPVLTESEKNNLPQNYEIEFENVFFSYDTTEVLAELSFRLKQGTLTAIVGPSGSGKTTIAQLIPRLWDINNGCIKIGGINIKDIPYNALMNIVSFVFQDNFIFTDTIYENIRMGKENVSRAAVLQAAEKAQCSSFIEALTDGYETIIGEGGSVHLSGGERQRIALARVILKDSPIVILDEATAYMDPENETKVQQAFSSCLQNKTVIVIAHRLSTITEADKILVVKEGKIIEQGSHPELLKQQNMYQQMWENHQKAGQWIFNIQ